MKISLTILSGICVVGLAACSSNYSKNEIVDKGQYWQRSSVSDAAYMQGPKAQQMLNNDIAACVTELRELERLGQIKKGIPANAHDKRVISSDEMALRNYEEPERVKYLLSENGEYHDFETCMVAKGWERIKYVPYDTAHEARKNYMKNHVNYKYEENRPYPDSSSSQTQADGEYGTLNQ